MLALRGLKKFAAFSFLNNIAQFILVLLLIADAYSNHKELPIYVYTISVLLMTFLFLFCGIFIVKSITSIKIRTP